MSTEIEQDAVSRLLTGSSVKSPTPSPRKKTIAASTATALRPMAACAARTIAVDASHTTGKSTSASATFSSIVLKDFTNTDGAAAAVRHS
jgi:hypothetical protein